MNKCVMTGGSTPRNADRSPTQ